MKKIILGMIILSSLSYAQGLKGPQSHLYIGGSVGTNRAGAHADEVKNNKIEFSGFSEITVDYKEQGEFGLGFGYSKSELKSTLDDKNLGTIRVIPVYATYKFHIDSMDYKPYVKANFGGAFNSYNKDASDSNLDIDVSNGIYAGVGLGLDYNNFMIELGLDAITKTTTITEKTKTKVETKKESGIDFSAKLSLAYKFDF